SRRRLGHHAPAPPLAAAPAPAASPGVPEPPGLATLSPGAPPQAPDLLYADGLRAYSAGAWAPAVALLREALRSLEELGRTRRDCGARCAAEAALPDAPGPDSPPGPAPGAWERLLLRAALRRAECLSQCAARRLGPGGAARLRVGGALRDAFRRREPYNYLQRAYYQLKKLDLAAAAAHTFFVANPTHLQMREDMAKYRRCLGFGRRASGTWRRPHTGRRWDLESMPPRRATPLPFFLPPNLIRGTPPPGSQVTDHSPLQQAAYDSGLELLGRQEAGLALPRLEEALQESLAQMESCRAGCEGPEEHQERKRRKELGARGAIAVPAALCGGNSHPPWSSFPVPDFLPSQLRRLHEAHAQVGNLSQAVENVLSVLLFYPEDEAAKEALNQYQTQLGEPRPGLGPRQDIQRFVLRSLGEKRQLYYAMEHLGTSFKDPDPWTPAAFIPETLREKLREDQEQRPWDHEPPQPKPLTDWKDVLLLEGVTLTQDARQLNGSERAVLDGLLTPAECGVLLQLAKDAAEAGARSGYRGRRSPHTAHEHFEGLTVLKAAQLARAGAVSTQGAKLLLEVSERVRTLTQAYFSPERPLHLSFTHLVCRTAIKGEQEQRMDLSHPVHADNCVLDPDTGECWREPPAYTIETTGGQPLLGSAGAPGLGSHCRLSSSSSGLLYLNDDFQGGDLFFTEPNALTVRAQVRPRCGRLVAFSSGGENPHGVWAVTRGRRCALALWHTWAPEHREQEWTEAKELLQELEEEEGEEEGERRRKKCPAETLLQNPPAAGLSGSRTRLGSRLGSERSCEGLSYLTHEGLPRCQDPHKAPVTGAAQRALCPCTPLSWGSQGPSSPGLRGHCTDQPRTRPV
ncbi:hypothetical protein QTO34_017854, partial [Cnephaeus nilssonii]